MLLNCIGEINEAVQSWNKSIELNGANASDAHVNLANVYALNLKDSEKAVHHYLIAIKLTPKDGEVHYNLGVVLDSMGRLEEALEYYTKAVELGISAAEKNLRNAQARLLGKMATEKEAKSDKK
ncbi:hypothetical protein HDU76_005286 [Blyttiomyces sp. JEL0837]|nr:hypothetical protein HDU76_005286 [Blyttiomyces sp. JEL0837]